MYQSPLKVFFLDIISIKNYSAADLAASSAISFPLISTCAAPIEFVQRSSAFNDVGYLMQLKNGSFDR